MKTDKVKSYLASILLLTALVCVYKARALSQVSNIQPVGTPFVLKKADGTTVNDMIEPSAVDPIGDGKYLLVGDDKDGHLSIFKVNGEFKWQLGYLKGADGKDIKSPKWEAMAKDCGDNFYVIGNHSNEDRKKLVRFRLDTNAPNLIKIADGSEKSFTLKNLPVGGIKIEGLAVRPIDERNELVIGFRDPFDSMNKVQVYYVDNMSETQLTLKPFFQFAAEKPKDSPEPFKLSSIEYVKELAGFLILTSTEDDDKKPNRENKFYGNALWFVGDARIGKQPTATLDEREKPSWPAKKIWDFAHDPKDVQMKAEGLAVLPSPIGNKMRLVIMYDNDPGQTRIASKMECLEMSRDFKIERVGC